MKLLKTDYTMLIIEYAIALLIISIFKLSLLWLLLLPLVAGIGNIIIKIKGAL